MSIKKVGDKWVSRLQVNGRRQQFSFLNKADAQEHERNAYRGAAGLPARRKAVTLEQGWEAWKASLRRRGKRPETLRFYEGKYAALKKLLGPYARLDHIAKPTIDDYLERRWADGVSGKTIHEEIGVLHRMTEETELIPLWQMPDIAWDDNGRRPAQPEEAAAMWMALKGPAKVAFALCLTTGMRAGEAFRVTADDCDWGLRTIRLSARKEHDTIHVAMVDTLRSILPREGVLVAGSYDAVRMGFVRASARAKAPRVWYGPGLGRTTFSTWAVERGGFTENQVSDALGHRAKGVSTPTYIHARAVEPVRRPMSEFIEQLLLKSVPLCATELSGAVPGRTELPRSAEGQFVQ